MKTKRLIAGFLVFVSLFQFVGLFSPPEASANGRAVGYGYFFNLPATTGFNVLQGGLPTWIDTKPEFIAHIENLYYSTSLGGPCPGSGCDYPGSAYIIQTMRGPTAGSWDHSFPDGGDIANWKDKINNPQIGMAWGYDGGTAEGVTTVRYLNGNRDVAKIYGSTAGLTLRFYNINTNQTYYMIRQSCANPLGNFPGLPNPSDFRLTPSVSSTKTSAEGGEIIPLSGGMANNGTTPSSTVNWRLTRFTMPAANPNPTGGTTTAAVSPQSYYGNTFLSSESGTGVYSVGGNTVPLSNFTMPDLPLDRKLCFGLSVQPHSNGTTDWRHSNAFCVLLAKKPKLQVTGGDVIVGKGSTGATIVTSTTRKTVSGQDLTFGSWGEYAVTARGSITGMASGGGYSGGQPSTTACTFNALTITNAGTGTCSNGSQKGYYTFGTGLADLSTRFTPTTTQGGNPTVNLAQTNNSVIRYTGSPRLMATAEIPAGKTVIINSPGSTVTITSDIIYSDGPYTSIGQIPQIIIIANNILIQGNVQRIDAWLYATGTSGVLNTCSDVANATDLRATNCSNQLTVNGPIATRQLLLRRTHGAGSGVDSSIPSEIFNLRPDAYLWATNYNGAGGRIQTISSTELPPRF